MKRHPDIGDHVTIYAHATILGGDTRVGAALDHRLQRLADEIRPGRLGRLFQGRQPRDPFAPEKEATRRATKLATTHDHDWENSEPASRQSQLTAAARAARRCVRLRYAAHAAASVSVPAVSDTLMQSPTNVSSASASRRPFRCATPQRR